ncbi:MAG: hypothetical protein HYV19_13640 [Gemmatimonadetes bacterium]|nr:hypothetical protein [Gemmatimonadota bacterium]
MTATHRLVLIASLATAACHSQSASSARVSATDADSLRGTVERVGSEPLTQLVVRAPTGQVCTIGATGSKVPTALEGLEVTFWGASRLTSAPSLAGALCTIDVARYAVRAVDGVSAVDGMLHVDQGAFTLVLASGQRLPLRGVPSRMEGWVGERVYWAGPTDRAPTAYGLLP